MKIVVNAVSAVSGGSVVYLREILPRLGALGPQHSYLVVRSPWQEFWTFPLPPNVQLRTAPLPPRRSLARRLLWEQVGLPVLLWRERASVLFSTTDITSLLAPCPVVLAIRNPNPYSSGNLRRGLRYAARFRLFRAATSLSTRKAAAVVFLTAYSRAIVCQQLRIPKERTRVVHHGLSFPVRDGAVDGAGETPDRPYLLYVSDVYEHKNVPFLVRAFAQLVATLDRPYELRIVGRILAPREVAAAERLARAAGLASRVRFLGAVPHADLPALYRRASAFVFPSLLETFGQPLVEAMASGLPVVASNRSCIPEICGDAALFFDPEDVGDAATQMRRALTDAETRRRLLQRGSARARAFSWDTTAREMLRLFEAAAR